MRKPVDSGPATQPSLEARLPAGQREPVSVPPKPVAAAAQTSAADEPEATPQQAPMPEPPPPPAQPMVVPGQYHFLKRWPLVMVLIGVWIPAALIGPALYYYWFHLLHKTPAVFLTLMFIVACTVGAQLLTMVEHKPLVTALSIALLSAPFAATAAAAGLYGAYAFHWIPR